MSVDYQEIHHALRKVGQAESTLTVAKREYHVITTLTKSKYRWHYAVNVTPNDVRITAPEENLRAAPQHDEQRWTMFVQDAAQRHIEKCQAIRSYFRTVRRRQRRTVVTLVGGTAVLTGTLVFYLLSRQPMQGIPFPATSQPMATSAPLEPPAALPISVGSLTTLPADLMAPPPSAVPAEPASPVNAASVSAPPAADAIEALLTGSVAGPSPAASQVPDPSLHQTGGTLSLESRPESTVPRRALGGNPAEEEKIRCIILPSLDCP